MLSLQQDNGEIWSALGSFDDIYLQLRSHAHLGHCYLMQDDLQKAYSAYQHALYSLPNPKVFAHKSFAKGEFSLLSKQENPKLWYGIGILYDRYGSLDNAEEAFSSVLKMDKGTLVHARVQFTSHSSDQC